MKKYYLIFLMHVLTGAYLNSYSQVHLIQWQRALGGSREDFLYSTQQTADSGFINIGFTASNNGDVTGNHGGLDFWIVKLSINGMIEWQKALGGTQDDVGHSIKQTSDGGYIVTGSTTSFNGDVTSNHGGHDVWVIKLSSLGIIEWQKTYGGNNTDIANVIEQTNDGGYIIGGATTSNDGDVTGNPVGSRSYWVLKVDGFGNLQWQKLYINGGDITSINQTTDNGFIVAGEDGSQLLILKLDQTGTILWQRTLGGTGYDFHPTIEQTNDGGYILSAGTESQDGDVTFNHGVSDFWVVKLNNNGVIQWQKTYGGSLRDYAFFIQETSDNNYIVGGTTDSNNGDLLGVGGGGGAGDFWLLKLNPVGSILWQKRLGGGGQDLGFYAASTKDNGYLISGISNLGSGDVTGHHAQGTFDYWVVKLTPDITVNIGVVTGSYCPGPNLIVPFSITGPFNPGNTFFLQLSDSNGIFSSASFNSPFNIANVPGTMGGNILGYIPEGTPPGSNYRVRVFSSDPLIVGPDNGNNITIRGGSVSVGDDISSYFGYLPNQCITMTANILSGTAPYTFIWSLNRPLLHNVVNSTGNETMLGINSQVVSLCLLDTADLCLTVIDATGCTFTDCATIFASDVRCFAGNSGSQKVNVCHNGNSICVSENAVSAHLSHGDYVGPCITNESNQGETIIEKNSKPGFNIYPNPSNGDFIVSLNLADVNTKGDIIQIINVSGQVIKRINVYEQSKINISLKESGIYFIRLITNKQILTKKVTVIQ